MEIAFFIAGLAIGVLATSIVCRLITKTVGTLHVKNGRPAQLDIENWFVLRNSKRAYLKLDQIADEVEISQNTDISQE